MMPLETHYRIGALQPQTHEQKAVWLQPRNVVNLYIRLQITGPETSWT